MAPRDPVTPQLDFPALVADIIKDLRLTGQVGLLNFSDEVSPIYIVGARPGGAIFQQNPIIFDDTSMISGSVTNPVANTIILDTGRLPAGIYDFNASISYWGQAGLTDGIIELQHRDAANAVTLAIPLTVAFSQTISSQHANIPIAAAKLTSNDRFRVQVLQNQANGRVAANIWAQRRPDL